MWWETCRLKKKKTLLWSVCKNKKKIKIKNKIKTSILQQDSISFYNENTKNNKWQKTQTKIKKKKNVLTSDINYILYCPFAIFSMCSHQKCPFHGLGIVFPQQSIAFLKLGPLCSYSFKSGQVTYNRTPNHWFDINWPFKGRFSLILLVKHHLTQSATYLYWTQTSLHPTIHSPRKALQDSIPTWFYLDRSVLAE